MSYNKLNNLNVPKTESKTESETEIESKTETESEIEQKTYNGVYYADSMDMEAAMREDAKRRTLKRK